MSRLMLARANEGETGGVDQPNQAKRKHHLQPAHSLPPFRVSSNYSCPVPSPKAEFFPEEMVLREQ